MADTQPLEIRESIFPDPAAIDWSQVSEVHYYGFITSEAYQFGQLALTKYHKDLVRKDDEARESYERYDGE